MNYLTKWPEAKAIQRADTEFMAKFIYQDLMCQHGCPKELLSNQETHFVNRTLAELKNKWQKAADHIQKLQEKQKERHNNQLPDKLVEFKIGDKVLLYYIKAEKQWSGKFDSK
ncbi:hypothetical protein G9A89_014197 [Geosiphon pyriformis]|nr:hypothetical protein G9A89_014197 [Geosiphon pyriformis]